MRLITEQQQYLGTIQALEVSTPHIRWVAARQVQRPSALDGTISSAVSIAVTLHGYACQVVSRHGFLFRVSLRTDK